MYLIREKLAEVRLMDLTRDELIVDKINDYFNRADDHDQIRSAIKSRFGVGIATETDPANPENPYKLYSRKEFTTQVDGGLIDAINIGWGQKIVAALATLFTEKGQRYELVSDNEDADLSAEMEYIDGIRSKGGYRSAVVDADRMSIQCGSSAVFPVYKNGGIKYQVVSPSEVRVYWPNVIYDGETRRAPDYTDIEDAYAIVIRLSQIDQHRYNYLAIFGRSEDYPNGRWVDYVSDSHNTELPKIGQDESTEYELDGSPANPLSAFANGEGAELNTPEFPLAIIKGFAKSSNTPFPVSTSLFNDSIEYDLSGSHTKGKSDSAAAGLTVVSLDHTGTSVPLPRTLEGATTALPGQTIEHISKNAMDVQTSYQTLKMAKIDGAAGYGVPDFMVASEDHTLDASSGIALQVKTRPLVKERARREEINQTSVEKIFLIEKALLAMFDESPQASALLPLSQIWNAGPLELPENKKEKAERLKVAKDAGFIDTIEAIREFHNLPSDTEAIQFYEKMKERASKYPELNPAPVKQGGLFRASNLQGQQQQNGR